MRHSIFNSLSSLTTGGRRHRRGGAPAERHPGGRQDDLRARPVVVKKELTRLPGVTSTTIDLDAKTATVTFDPDKTATARLTQATTEAECPSKLIAKP